MLSPSLISLALRAIFWDDPVIPAIVWYVAAASYVATIVPVDLLNQYGLDVCPAATELGNEPDRSIDRPEELWLARAATLTVHGNPSFLLYLAVVVFWIEYGSEVLPRIPSKLAQPTELWPVWQ